MTRRLGHLTPLALLLFLAALVLLLPTEAAARKVKPDPGKDKPRLSLIADPAFGFTPVTVTLTGHLTGVDLHDRNFCHAAVTWVRIDPGQTERDNFRVRRTPPASTRTKRSTSPPPSRRPSIF